jgi:hypothetical protein
MGNVVEHPCISLVDMRRRLVYWSLCSRSELRVLNGGVDAVVASVRSSL